MAVQQLVFSAVKTFARRQCCSNNNRGDATMSCDGGDVMNLTTPAESQIYFQKEMQRLSKIVKDGNIKAD